MNTTPITDENTELNFTHSMTFLKVSHFFWLGLLIFRCCLSIDKMLMNAYLFPCFVIVNTFFLFFCLSTLTEPKPIIESSAFGHCSHETTKIRPNLPEEEVKVDMMVLTRKRRMRWQRGKIVEIVTKGKKKFTLAEKCSGRFKKSYMGEQWFFMKAVLSLSLSLNIGLCFCRSLILSHPSHSVLELSH